MVINHNMQALNAQRQMSKNQVSASKNMEKLSSGLRINRAGDDAAGLSISEKMRGQIKGLNQASRNAQDGISLIQTTEGALGEAQDIMQRMRELAVQSANDTNVTVDRTAIKSEFSALASEVERIKDTTQFNTQNLLNGTAGAGADGKLQIQVGANSGQEVTVDLGTAGVKLDDIVTALKAAVVDTQAGAKATITVMDTQLAAVSSGRSYLGAAQNRLEYSIKNLDNAAENTQSAESRIRDVDMAKEMMEMTKTNILNQAGQAMLSQANQNPQQVLKLLQ